MKKKLLISLIIVIVATLGVLSFSSCSQTTPLTSVFAQSNVWNNIQLPEVKEYVMLDKDGKEVGTYKTVADFMKSNTKYYIGFNNVTLDEIENPYFSFQSKNINLTCIKSELKVGETYLKTTETYFESNFLMIASCTYINDNGQESFICSTNTDNKKYYYKKITKENGELIEKSYSIKNGKYESSAYFDNTMTFIIARAMPNDADYTSFSYKVFDTKVNDKVTVSVSNDHTKASEIKVYNNTTYDCKKVIFSTTDSLLGKTNNITVHVALDKDHTICKIEEGEYIYLLK